MMLQWGIRRQYEALLALYYFFCQVKKNTVFIKKQTYLSWHSCDYVPGSPGGAWSQEELLTVRAKLWMLYTNDYVYKLKSLFGKFGLPAPSNGIDLQFFPAKVKYEQSRSEMRYLLTLNQVKIKTKLDLAFNNVKPKDWYFVLD